MPVQDNEIPKAEKQVFENESDKLKQEDILEAIGKSEKEEL